MTRDYEQMSVFEQIKGGLNDAIAHARGELTLKTTVLPQPPPPMSPARVVKLRKRLSMSQRIFAAYLNVSLKLVQTWEHGSRVPRGGTLRLLEILENQPGMMLEIHRSPQQNRSNGSQSKVSKHRRLHRAVA